MNTTILDRVASVISRAAFKWVDVPVAGITLASIWRWM